MKARIREVLIQKGLIDDTSLRVQAQVRRVVADTAIICTGFCLAFALVTVLSLYLYQTLTFFGANS